jgi:hypothetical protein
MEFVGYVVLAMPSFPLSKPLVVAAIVFLLGTLYSCAYGALLKIEIPDSMMGRGPWKCHAEYRIGGAISHYAFWPCEQVDRACFPTRWQFNDAEGLLRRSDKSTEPFQYRPLEVDGDT